MRSQYINWAACSTYVGWLHIITADRSCGVVRGPYFIRWMLWYPGFQVWCFAEGSKYDALQRPDSWKPYCQVVGHGKVQVFCIRERGDAVVYEIIKIACQPRMHICMCSWGFLLSIYPVCLAIWYTPNLISQWWYGHTWHYPSIKYIQPLQQMVVVMLGICWLQSLSLPSFWIWFSWSSWLVTYMRWWWSWFFLDKKGNG